MMGAAGFERRLRVLVLIAALPVASVAGCDGDEEKPAPTKKEFIAQAEAVCRAAERDLDAAGTGLYTGDGVDEEEVALVKEKILPIFRRQVDELRELTPPRGDEQTIERALAAAERDLDDLIEDPGAVPKGWQEFMRRFVRYGMDGGPCVD
jgi:hypothetical protein